MVVGDGNCQYAISTATGTVTVNSQGPRPQPQSGLYYGARLIALGTAPVLTVLDLYTTVTSTGTTTTTTTIDVCTGTAAGQAFPAMGGAVGLRLRGSLVVVSTGTAAGTWLVGWD